MSTPPLGAYLPDHPDFLWRNPTPKKHYSMVIVGGGGHGLATAHYLATKYGVTDVAVLEKGYRSFGTDMTYEHDPYEAGLGFAVRLDKGDFLGRDAVVERSQNVRRRLVLLTLEHPDQIVLGSEPVYAEGGDRPLGYVTSASFSYSLGQSLAYAWLPAEQATSGTRVQIGYFGDRYRAVVTDEPGFDPEMKLIRR